MRNDRFSFVLIIGVYCIQNACAMEIIKSDSEKSDMVIELRRFRSEDYTKNISKIKDLDIKQIRSSLKNEQFLPDQADMLNHLLYLSTIGESNIIKTLFTQQQQNKFDACSMIQRSVPWHFAINGAVIIATSLLSYTNLMGLRQCSNVNQTECLSQVTTIVVPATFTVLGTLVAGFFSLYATGLVPDASARKANKIQDEIGFLNRNYTRIAKYWLDIYFNCPEQAVYIADKFNINELKNRAQCKTHKTKIGGSLVSPLEEAWHFIKYNTALITFTEIENYLYNKTCCRRIESLEKIVHEQNAEIENLKNKKNV